MSDTNPASDNPDPFAGLIPGDPLMAAAWLGSLQFALGREDILEAFRLQTGNLWRPARTPLDRMVDEATGVDAAFFRAFAKWHNEQIWGEDDDRPIDGPDDGEERT